MCSQGRGEGGNINGSVFKKKTNKKIQLEEQKMWAGVCLLLKASLNYGSKIADNTNPIHTMIDILLFISKYIMEEAENFSGLTALPT